MLFFCSRWRDRASSMVADVPIRRLVALLLVLIWADASCNTLFAQIPQQTETQRRLEMLREKRAEYRLKLLGDLSELARRLEAEGNLEAAKTVQESMKERTRSMLQVPRLPREVQPPLPANLSDAERQWRNQLRIIHESYAEEIYGLARSAQRSKLPSFTFLLVQEAVRHHPDFAPARELLGFVRFGDEWVSPFERDQIRRGYVDHPKFGWLPKTHVEKYDNGERYYNGRWISAEKEAVIRQDFRQAWVIRTEHYLVKTNRSLEAGVELSRKLEAFHHFFLNTFVGFYNSPTQMQKLFSGSQGRRLATSQLYEVHFFRNQQEYVGSLQRKMPNIGVTNGLYFMPDRTAYFFHDENMNIDATLFHEATHQLLYESEKRQRLIGERDHFWIIEGIACYMESFEIGEREASVGDPRFIRFYWARHRVQNEDYYIPLRQFTRFGRVDFQQAETAELRRRYSQATGLAHFFLHYDGGRYRDALVEHLTQLYDPDPRIQDRAQSLETLTGVPFDELDRQYVEHLEEMGRIAGGEITGNPTSESTQ